MQIQGNVFVKGTGIGMNLGDANLPTKIRIDGNSFFRNAEWMRLLGDRPLTPEVWVTNNLLLGVEGITVQGRALEDLCVPGHSGTIGGNRMAKLRKKRSVCWPT